MNVNYVHSEVHQRRPYAVEMYMHAPNVNEQTERNGAHSRKPDAEIRGAKLDTDELTRGKQQIPAHSKHPQCGGCKLHLSLRASLLSLLRVLSTVAHAYDMNNAGAIIESSECR